MSYPSGPPKALNGATALVVVQVPSVPQPKSKPAMFVPTVQPKSTNKSRASCVSCGLCRVGPLTVLELSGGILPRYETFGDTCSRDEACQGQEGQERVHGDKEPLGNE